MEKDKEILLPSKRISTPFGKVKTPPIELPPLEPPLRPDQLSKRQDKAFDHAVGVTGAQIVGSIPVIGTALSDMLEDMHGPKLKKLLTAEEREKFIKYDRTYPTLIAFMRAIQETRSKK